MYESGNEDSTDDIIDEINQTAQTKQNEAEILRQNTLEQMKTNRDNAEKEEKKKQILFGMIDERINPLKELTMENSQKIDGIIGELQKIGAYLQQGQVQAPAEPQSKIGFGNLPPELQSAAFEGIAGLGTSIAQIIQAFKGQNSAPQVSPLGQLGEQMITDLVRTTIDDIQQRVYGIRKLPPPSILKDAAPTHHGLE